MKCYPVICWDYNRRHYKSMLTNQLVCTDAICPRVVSFPLHSVKPQKLGLSLSRERLVSLSFFIGDPGSASENSVSDKI